MEAGYLVIVYPADGWGSEWYEMYRTKERAETRIRELAERYEMEIAEGKSGIEAQRFDDFNYDHRISMVVMEHMYYED